MTFLGVMLAVAVAGGPADEATGQDAIRVALRTGTVSGIVAPGAEDSVKDLRKALRGRPVLAVVEDGAGVDLVLQVESRGREFRLASTPYVTRDPRAGQSVTASHARQSCVVYVRLVAGGYEKVVEGVGDSWARAAKDVAGQAESWIRLNEAQLRKVRPPTKP